MSPDHTQEALDEYFTTGVDLTGGELGPDFDPETGRLLSDIEEGEDTEDEETDYETEQGSSLMDNLDRLKKLVDARLAELKKKRK